VPEYVQTWRRKLRLKILVEIANHELKSNEEIETVYKKLDQEMKIRWNLVSTTRKLYLEDISKILTNQNVVAV